MADGALRRRIRKGLQAGVLDTEGQVLPPGTGSPRLAQVFLHDVLDWWFHKVVKRHGRGDVCLMRYADDCVCACADHAEAERFDNVRGQRLETCGLERSGAKPRIIPCSRHRQAGKTSFALLGCELRGGTARKTLRTSLKRCTAWCQKNRHLRWLVLFTRLHAKLRGYDNDYGVHGHAASLTAFFTSAIRRLLTWRNRRRQRHRYTWPGDNEVLERFPIARPRIVGRPQTKSATCTTSADLRKRVLLKSPVRAHRPPGSVRGPSSNRRSYRDGALSSL